VWGWVVRVSRVLASCAVALAVAVPVAVASYLGLLATVQAAAGDWLFKTRAPRAPRVTVVVGIDQRSYQALLPEYGPLSQWPRTLYARALDQLREPAGPAAAEVLRDMAPRVVAFEIFFDGSRPGDDELARAVRRSGSVITPVLAQGPLDFDPVPGVAQRFDAFVRPVPEVRAAAAGEGLVNVTGGGDGVIRSLPLVLRSGREVLPSMALTVVALHARRPRVLDGVAAAGGSVLAAGRRIPVGEGDSMLINYLGPPSQPGQEGMFPVIPFVDVINGNFDRALVRDRIVLIGPTIRGVDEHPTPTSTDARMWGVEIMANAIETILDQRYLVRAGAPSTIAAIAILALLAALLVAWTSPWVAAAGTLAALVGYLTLAAVMFERGVVMNLVHPPIALLGAFAVSLVYRVVFVEAERRLARQTVARYLSPSVGRWVLADPRRLALGGELRAMTVLFSDIRDFTTHGHALAPDVLVALLNRYRSVLTEVVFARDGVLAQYAGDAVEAFWNAPMDQPDHAQRACHAALDMVAALGALRAYFAERGWRRLDIGIGINTGQMVVGNMGSPARLDYSAVGDSVNVAARLEGLTKEYGVHVIVGEETRAAAGEAFVYRFLDVVVVKGRPEPVRAYEVVARAGEVMPARLASLRRFEEGVDLYRSRRWADAERLFAELAVRNPDDGPTMLYARRSRAALDDPPPPDWAGVHVARVK
jgi:adenylate cyclase